MFDVKKNKHWIFAFGLIVTFLTIFSTQLGVIAIILIVMVSLLCVGLYTLSNTFSNSLSLHIETRIFYRTKKELFVPHIGEHREKAEPRKIMRYIDVFYFKLIWGIVLTLILVYPLSFIFTATHELAHAVTGVIIGVQVYEIRFLSPLRGYTNHSIVPSDLKMSFLVVAGSLSVIIFGLALSALIYRNKRVKLETFFPIWYAVWHNVTGTVDYWYRSIFSGIGDGWSFLTYNPNVIPLKLANFCILLQTILSIYLLFMLGLKIVSRIFLFLQKYVPDLSLTLKLH